MAIIGALALTIIAAMAIMWLIGVPWLGLGFGGPSVSNWSWMVLGLASAAGVVIGWWNFVGSNIHFSFG
jgi:hypothetical protein